MCALFYSNKFSSALTKHLPLCPNGLSVCMSLHCKLRLCLETQKYNVTRKYNGMTIQIVWYNSK